jgi:purine catabolism regulator
VKTLEAYFNANQVSQQAARDLFIHPKTLKYRLRRIKEILGIDPFKGDRQLAFYLAAKLTRL